MADKKPQYKIQIEQKDSCPEYVYKYCSQDVFESYIKQGSFRLGSLADYRNAYESKGAEYGDSVEGNPSQLLRGLGSFDGRPINPEGGIVIDYITNAHVFSTSFSYSADDHEKWYKREGCGYDICLKIKAKQFFQCLALATYDNGYKNAKFFVAKPIYNNGTATLLEKGPFLVDNFLVKDRSLCWEKEYRFICAIPGLSPFDNRPIIVKSMRALNFIEKGYVKIENK